MIRKFEAFDPEQLMKIWLNGNKDAHCFIASEYWEKNAPYVREQLLQAEIYVFETQGTIKGFVGLQDDYLAGIFVEKEFRCMGIGKQLLDHVKKLRQILTLNVYQKNERAVKFYLQEGFSIVSEGTDIDTGEAEYTMRWVGREDQML